LAIATIKTDCINLNQSWPSAVDGTRNKVFSDQYYRVPHFDLLRGRPYNRLTVQTSRGYPLAVRRNLLWGWAREKNSALHRYLRCPPEFSDRV